MINDEVVRKAEETLLLWLVIFFITLPLLLVYFILVTPIKLIYIRIKDKKWGWNQL